MTSGLALLYVRFPGENPLSTGWVKDSRVKQQLVNSDQSDPEQKAGGLGKKLFVKPATHGHYLKPECLVKPPYRFLDIFGFILCL